MTYRPHPAAVAASAAFKAAAEQQQPRPLIPCRFAAATGRPCPIHAEARTTITITPQCGDPDQVTIKADSHGISPAAVAYALRQTADQLDEKARALGDEPIPYRVTVHDALLDEQARQLADAITELGTARGWSVWAADYIHPDRTFVDPGAPDADEHQAAEEQQAAGRFAEELAAGQARCDAVADQYATAPDWVDEVRQALAFNARATAHPAVITLRDVLLDTAERTPRQALDAACILLAAHTRELSAQAENQITAHRAETPKGSGVRALRTGMASIRRLLDEAARRLDPQT